MELIREVAKVINEKVYTKIKMTIMNRSNEYVREGRFVRELVFDYGDNLEMPENKNNRVQYSIVFDRYKKDELYLIGKRRNSELINEIKTKITMSDVIAIIDYDYTYLDSSDNVALRQLSLQMKYNNCYPLYIKEYFQEKYYNVVRKDIIDLKSMEILIENDVKEFFADNLTPIEDIDYDKIKLNYRQNILLPVVAAG